MNNLALFGIWCVERLNTWQTLLTGIAAVAAAVLTIRQTGKQHRDELRRKGYAARATLAIVLSDICDWATKSANQLVELRNSADDNGALDWAARRGVKLDRASQDNIASLQRVIEATDEESVINRIWKMLGRIQVLSGRVRGLDDRTLLVNEVDLNGYIIEAATIYAQASSLFDYARRASNGAQPVVWGDVASALHLFGLYTGRDDALYEQVERYNVANIDPES